jgi:mono/diheme cytochrome c family protein
MIPKKIQDWLKEWSPPFYPGLFRATLFVVVGSAIFVPLAILAIPYLEIFNDMAVQPKGKTQGLYGNLYAEEQVVERAPVAGTLPIDHHPYPFIGKDEKTQKMAEEALKNPIQPTMKVLKEGQKLFNYYCITCHGEEGEGNGPIIGPDLFPAPPSLHTDAARKFNDGRIFHNIQQGQNTMPGYADKFTPKESWAIVHYVHALQRAKNPKKEDLEK